MKEKYYQRHMKTCANIMKFNIHNLKANFLKLLIQIQFIVKL